MLSDLSESEIQILTRACKCSLINKQMQVKNSTQWRVVLIFYFSGIQSIEQVCFEHVAILSLLIKNIIIIMTNSLSCAH